MSTSFSDTFQIAVQTPVMNRSNALFSISNSFHEASAVPEHLQREKTAFQKNGITHQQTTYTADHNPNPQGHVNTPTLQTGARDLMQQKQDTTETLGRAATDAQTLKNQALNSIGIAAEQSGISPSQAKRDIAPTETSPILEIAAQSLGPAVEIPSFLKNVLEDRKSLKPGEKADIIRQAASHLNQQTSGSGAINNLTTIATPAPQATPPIDEKAITDMVNKNHPEIERLQENIDSVENAERQNKVVENITLESEAAVYSMTGLKGITGLNVSGGQVIFDPLAKQAFPDSSTLDEMNSKELQTPEKAIVEATQSFSLSA